MKKQVTAIFLIVTLFNSKAVLACELGCMLGISLGLHVMAAAIYIKQEPSATNPTGKPFTVNLAPKAPAASTVPAGWAAGASQFDTPVPPLALASPPQTPPVAPSTVTQSQAFQTAQQSQYTIAQCKAAFPDYPYSGPYSSQSSSTGNITAGTANGVWGCTSATGVQTPLGTWSAVWGSVCPSGSTLSGGQCYYPAPTCPSGYTYSNSSCNLATPENVPLPNDGQKILERKGNQFASPRDADPMPQGVTQPDPYTVNYAYPDGGYVEAKTDPVTGVTTIKNVQYDPASDTTLTQNATFAAPSSTSATGVSLEGYSSQTTNGNGEASSTNGGSLGAGSSNGATGADVNAAFNNLNAKLDANNKSLESLLKGSDNTQGSQDSINTSLDGINTQLTNSPNIQLPSLNWFPSLMPGTGGGCAPFPVDANPTMGLAAGFVGHGEIDICDKLYFVRELLGYFLSMFTIFYIFRVFTRANKGT